MHLRTTQHPYCLLPTSKESTMKQNSCFQQEIKYLTPDKEWCECEATLRLQLITHQIR